MMPTRKTYAALALAFGVFAIYGSLVPLEFHAQPIGAALAGFRRIEYFKLGIDSRADWVSNVLLFIPLGFLCMGALRADRRGAAGSLTAGMAVAAGCFALSIAIEFTQIFFPPRTVSLNDIVAETFGAFIGVGAWLLLGAAVTEWTRQYFRERERPALLVRLLTFYAVAFLISQLLPLDIAITPGELAQKYAAGRIILRPFDYPYPSTFSLLWDLANDVLLNAPLGALVVVGWSRMGRRRSGTAAFLLGAAIVVGVELAQLFVFSRVADVTDVMTGSVGIALGVGAAIWLSRRDAPASAPNGPRASALRLWPRLAAVVWLAALVTYAWYPFDFVVDREMVRERLPIFLAVPFRSYYFGTEFHAFTELMRKGLLALPLGVLLRLAWPLSHRRGIARLQSAVVLFALFGIFTGIEMGQIFLPDRFPDLTDAFISEGGAMVGLYLTTLLARPQMSVAAVRAEA